MVLARTSQSPCQCNYSRQNCPPTLQPMDYSLPKQPSWIPGPSAVVNGEAPSAPHPVCICHMSGSPGRKCRGRVSCVRQLLGSSLRLNIYGKEEEKIRTGQKEKLNAISVEASANSLGSCKARMILQSCPELRR